MTAITEDRRNIDAVLAERARLLARPIMETSSAATVELVSFGAAGERYAVETAFVHRLERCTRITPLPGAARHFAGVTNLHGRLMPLIDLGILLGAPACTNAAFVVVLGAVRPEFGLIADALIDLFSLPPEALGALGPAPRPLVRHVTSTGIAVIDALAVIADPRLIAGATAAPTNEEAPG